MHDFDQTTLEVGDDEIEDSEFDFESDGLMDSEADSPFTEAEEMELAAELLAVSDDQELDYFLGNVFKKIGRGVRSIARSPVGKFLGKSLRAVAKKALPIAGGALGNLIAPGVGGAIGSRLAGAAGRAFGLELEGLSPEDQEFEIARRVVRLAGTAAQKAASAPASMPPQRAASSALAAAARRHAPGLLRGGSFSPVVSGGSRTGRWIRRGRKIIVLGV